MGPTALSSAAQTVFTAGGQASGTGSPSGSGERRGLASVPVGTDFEQVLQSVADLPSTVASWQGYPEAAFIEPAGAMWTVNTFGALPYGPAEQAQAGAESPVLISAPMIPVFCTFLPQMGAMPIVPESAGMASPTCACLPDLAAAAMPVLLAPPVTTAPGGAATLSSFVLQWNSHLVDTQPKPGIYECVDLANQYCDQVLGPGHRIPCADACQMLANANPTQYTAVHYAPGLAPSPGDLVVWGSNLPGSGGAGHVDVCLSATTTSFTGFDQNWGPNNASPCQPVQHDYSHVLGWLHPTGQ